MSKAPVESSGPVELWEDDLAGTIQNEYDPMIPNNYEMIVKQKRAEERSRDSEVRQLTRTYMYMYVCTGIYIWYIYLCGVQVHVHVS